MTTRRRLFFVVQLGFGSLLALGATFEVVNLLVPTLFPEIQDVPIMRLHHENDVVRIWTLASNLLTVPIGAGLAIPAFRALTGRESGTAPRRALAGLAAVLVGAIAVSGRYLVWPALFRFGADSAETIVAISVVSSWFGLGTMLWLLSWGNRRIERASAPAA